MNTDLPVPVIVFDFLAQYTSLRMSDSSKKSNNKQFTSASKVCSQMLCKKSKDYKTEGQSRIVLFAVYFSEITSRLVDVVT